MTPETRARLVLRAHGRCERCRMPLSGTWDSWSAHHRRPRGMGGTRRPDTDSLANLVALCGTGTTGCHGWVEANRFQATAEGWLVRQRHDPAQVPVLLAMGWRRLLPDGGLAACDEEGEAVL